MSEKALSEFLGEQCRKYRKMRGLTLEELAEKLNTTYQTISNYEKNGIKNVDVEKEISTILGVDLREETADKEGSVGEVGKEILFCLIQKGGSCAVSYLESDELYGMSKERIDHEIAKIAELDMCSRDKYVDFYGKDRDDLFITAKGIITYKNMISDKFHEKKLRKLLPDIVSYEQALRPMEDEWFLKLPAAKDMEEYVELRPWIKNIYSIPFERNFMADYIAYLYCNWTPQTPQIRRNNIKKDAFRHLFPAKTIYHDILYRMAYGFTNEWRNEYLFGESADERNDPFPEKMTPEERQREYEKWEEEQMAILEQSVWEDEYYANLDEAKESSKWDFSRELPWAGSDDTYSKEDIIDALRDKKWEYIKKLISDDYKEREVLYQGNAPAGKEKSFPDEWFTRDEIETFIRENYHPPRNSRERRFLSTIREIEEMIPQTMSYFRFSKEWEENGLADLVRELCCVEME